MIKTIIAYLYKRILIGSDAEDKDAEAHRLISEKPKLREVYEHLTDPAKRRKSIEMQESSYPTAEAYDTFMRQIGAVPGRSRSWHPVRWMVAALLILSVSFAYYFWAHRKDTLEIPAEKAAAVLPAINKATLTLTDGQVVELSSGHDAIIIGNREITYSDGTEILNHGTVPDSHRTPGGSAPYLQLTTPKGGTYQMILPDGTRVWLNAGSTIKYPDHFSSDNRTIELEGEAFFAARGLSATPLIVKSQGQEVAVLGTEFNIAAYPGEKEIKTTLVTGSVRVTAHIGSRDQSLVLKPGEETIRFDTGLKKQVADIPAVVAWKDGVFYFNNTPFDQTMKQLSRWYNIEIVYSSGRVPGITFTGRMSRNVPLNVVLNFLKTSQVDFRVEAGKLMIL